MQTEEFKSAVGKFPTGVCVITTSFEGKLYGFTANSFASVSLDPALISFCLNKKAGSIGAFKSSEFIGVNILASDQAVISTHFAQKKEDKFQGIEHYLSGSYQVPAIKNVASFLECKKYKSFDCGDHIIFVAQVSMVEVDEKKPSLLYFAKSYREIS